MDDKRQTKNTVYARMKKTPTLCTGVTNVEVEDPTCKTLETWMQGKLQMLGKLLVFVE